MSKRPTPETDALIISKGGFGMTNYEWREHSRRIERERDEALEALRTLAEHGENEIQKLIKERDEARESAAKWESSFDAMERAGAEQARRADENREWALRAERERDEARNKMADALQEVDLRTLDYLRFREAIIATLEENRHLADGDDCTLAKLKSVVPDWK